MDVTEAQFTIIAIHLISAIFGPQIWMLEVVLFLIMLSVLYMARISCVAVNRTRFISLFSFYVSFLHDCNLTNGKCVAFRFVFSFLKHNHRIIPVANARYSFTYTHAFVTAYTTQIDSIFTQLTYIPIFLSKKQLNA